MHKQISFQTELNQNVQACRTSIATGYLTSRVYQKRFEYKSLQMHEACLWGTQYHFGLQTHFPWAVLLAHTDLAWAHFYQVKVTTQIQL